MTKHQIGALASRLLGLYFIIHSAGYLSAMGTQLSLRSAANVVHDELLFITITLACFAFTLGAGIYLFLRAERITDVIVKSDEPDEHVASVRSRNIGIIAFSTVGILVTVQTVPHVLGLILNYWFSREGWSYRNTTSAVTYIDFVTSLLQLGIGLWLLFGSSAIARFVNRIRGGVEEE